MTATGASAAGSVDSERIARDLAALAAIGTQEGGGITRLAYTEEDWRARAYIMALPKTRALRAHWQHAGRLMLQQASAAALTRQVHVALFMDGKLDAGTFEHMSSARRWRRYAVTS